MTDWPGLAAQQGLPETWDRITPQVDIAPVAGRAAAAKMDWVANPDRKIIALRVPIRCVVSAARRSPPAVGPARRLEDMSRRLPCIRCVSPFPRNPPTRSL